MKATMWKTTLREIRQSMGRFLAILAIVALGISLFAGLKVTKPFMLETAEAYLKEKNFYDFRLLSDYGFEAADVDYLAAKPETRSVQGAYTYDVLYEYGEEDAISVMRVHSLTEGVNELEVLYGRLPADTGECVVDSRLYGEEAIGQKIRLSAENEEDTLDCFKEKEFTIVGVVNASYYMQFERGNTSLGNGKVDGFAYVISEAFDSEIFTEIFVKLDRDFALYSEAYDAYIDEKEPEWKVYTKQAAEAGFQRILAEAKEELADAKKEFAEEKAEAEAELTDAEKELADAAQEIADAKKEITDAKAEIADGYVEIAEKEQELIDGEQELLENEQLLADKEQELAEGLETWKEGKWLLKEGRTKLEEQSALLETQEEQLLATEAELLTREAQFEAMLQIPGMHPGDEIVAATRAEFAAGKAQIAAGKEQISAYKEMIEDGYEQLADGDEELEAGWEELEDGRRQIEEAKQEIADAKTEIADGRQKIADGRKDLAEAEKELADAETELAEGEAEYQEGFKEYQEGLEEFHREIADAEKEIAEAEADLAELESPESYVLGRNTNIGYLCLESDSGIVADVADVFPIFFFLVAALVCMTTMNRMIEEQRTQIGVLKALGYSDGTIMAKYLFYAGSAGITGCVIGFFAGTWLFPVTIWTAYGMMYDMTSLIYYIDWRMAVISLIGSLLCSVGVTWYSCRVELLQVAAVLMRPKAPKAGKRVFLEYVPFLWKRLKFLQKVSIRNVLRYKKRFFMMIAGISGCTALLVAGFGILDSIKGVIGMQYSEIQLYDMSVTFQEQPVGEVYEEFTAAAAGRVENMDLFLETSMDLSGETSEAGENRDFVKSISLIVPKNPATIEEYINLHTPKGDAIVFPGYGEAVISHKLAEDYGITKGDRISLTDEEHNTFTVTVSGICENFVYNYVYLHPDTCRADWKEPEYKTAYLNVAEREEDMHLLSAALMNQEEVANVTVNADVQERFESMMSSMNYIVGVIILCAAALAFIVLYNLTNINITERIREIATIKVLGFCKKETATYVFRENQILTAIGAVVGLILGKVFHSFIMSCINIDMIAFDERVDNTSYLYSFLLTFVFAWFVNCFMSGKIDRISMTESLKSVD